MATDQDPDSAQNQKLKLLEQRIAQLELLVAQSLPKDALPQPSSANSFPGVKSCVTSSSELGSKQESNDTPTLSSAQSISSRAKADAKSSSESEENTKDVEEARVRYVIRQWDPKEKQYKDVDQDIKKGSETVNNSKPSPPRAFTYRKTFEEDGRTLESSEIEIEDTDLHKTLEDAVRKVYGNSFFFTWPRTHASPFSQFVHCYDELERISQPSDTDDERGHLLKRDIQSLMETVRTSPEMAPYFKERSESPNAIAFRYLWTLYPPGTEVVARPFFNQWQIFRVDQEPYIFHSQSWEHKPKDWSLKAWCYDYTGRRYTRMSHTFKVRSFDGSKDINQLPFYPLRYFKESAFLSDKTASETLREKAIANGNKFKHFCELPGAARMLQYEGSALVEGKSYENDLVKVNDALTYMTVQDGDSISRQYRYSTRRPDEEALVRPIEIKGRVIIDVEAYLEYGYDQLLLGDSAPSNMHYSEEIISDDRVPPDPDGDWARLCPPRILGYALDQKKMAQFNIMSAVEISERKDKRPYQNELQLKQAQKNMLLALVDQHESGENAANTVGDIIPNKGRSLVILLHGPPGVGKTLTAEVVTKAAGKPLLNVSVAEIGLNPARAESKLMRLFDLAAKWEAIVLVDEADVFLESRSSDADPERNSLVSVLLRVLEYYTGTIILTTNRISSLDIAVQSRIHLSIRYNELSDDDCTKIFESFVSKVEFEDNQEKKEVLEWFKNDVADEGLNGRQIRNLVATAQTIAKSNHQYIDIDCFKRVFKVTQEYQKQLTEQTARYRAENEVNYSRRK